MHASRQIARPALLLALALAASAPAGAQTIDELRLADPSRPALTALMQAGRPADALDALDTEFAERRPDAWPVDALVLRASLLTAAGRPAEAANTWTAVGALEPGLAEFAARAAVESLVQSAQPERAEARLDRLSTGGPARTHPDLVLRLASAYLDAGRADRAAELSRGVLHAQRRRSALADAAALTLARALEASGDVDGALEALHRAQLRHRASHTFITARAEARRLASATGRTPPAFTERDYRTLAERLASASRFATAIELLEEWLELHPGSANAEEAEAAIVDVLYRARRNDAARSRAAEFLRRHPASRRAAAVRLLQFRLDVREGRTEQVRTRGYAFWRGRVPRSTLTQRRSAALLLGAYLVGVGEVKAGLAVYRELYRASTTAAQQRDILWRAGVAAVRDGQLDRAAVNLRALMRRHPTAQLGLVGRYWLGVAEAGLGNRAAALEAFRQLIAQSPFGYYGARAADRYAEIVGTTGPGIGELLAPRQSFPELALSRAARVDPRLHAAGVLAQAGLARPAAQLARELAAAHRRDHAAGLLAARASARAGEHHLALTLVDRHFGRYLERPTRGLPGDVVELAYPKAHWDDVRKAAERERVDPLLLLSIVRQESRFEAPVRSVAGAVGLFQMMPYTASALAAELNIAAPDEAALAQPAVSAALGARLVRKLLTMFDGRVAPVAASYNAGEERTAVWWRAARDLPEPLFVDSIPYAETRNYVRRVLANYSTYRRLDRAAADAGAVRSR